HSEHAQQVTFHVEGPLDIGHGQRGRAGVHRYKDGGRVGRVQGRHRPGHLERGGRRPGQMVAGGQPRATFLDPDRVPDPVLPPGSDKNGRVLGVTLINGVMIAPGHTALTRMPSFAYSMAPFLVSPRIPCLVAAYAPIRLTPRSP